MTKTRYKEIKKALSIQDMDFISKLSSKEKLEYNDMQLGRVTEKKED